MGPDKNRELFLTVDNGGTVERLEDESMRRVLVGATLQELSEQFDNKADGQPTIVAEPVMVRKLYALSMIQRTRLGVAGFNPQAAIEFEASSDKITAYTAPPHDSFVHHGAGAQVNTRALKFSFRNGYNRSEDGDSPTEMFGLNLYIPAPDVETVKGVSEPAGEHPKLIVVAGESGKATTGGESYVAGETPLIAVRNKKTGDAKIYLLEDVERESIPEDLTSSQRVFGQDLRHPLIQGSVAWVELPDGQLQKITVLEGSALNQVAEEFADAANALQSGGINQLTVQERAAISALGADSALHNWPY